VLTNSQEKNLEKRLNALAYEAEDLGEGVRKEAYEQALEVLWDIQRQNSKVQRAYVCKIVGKGKNTRKVRL
jgi:hypothetical protein